MKRSSQTRPQCRRFASLATAAIAMLGLPSGATSDDSLAHAVPADVGLFAEVRGVGDLLTALTEPQIWTTLADLAGQPARPEDTAKWQDRIRQTVKMESKEAIDVLFARGVAFVGEGLGRSQDAVVLCRPAPDVTTADLLRKWDARRLRPPARPPTYRLYSNIGVAEHDGLLFFGDLLPRAGLFRRMQRFVAAPRAQSLADDPVFKKLLARVPERPDGVLFARLGQAATIAVPVVPSASRPATQPAPRPAWPELLPPLRNAENVLLALHRNGPLLHFTAVGDANEQRPAPPAAGPIQLVENLPERTLLAWQRREDFSKLAGTLGQLPEQSPAQALFSMGQHGETFDRLVRSLDTDVCLALGPVFPGQRAPGTPAMPAVALLVGTRDPAQAATELRNLADVCVAGYAVFALARGVPPLAPISETRVGDTPALLLDLSPLLKPTARKAVGQVHFCWAVHDRTLILASHSDWLRQIIAAREGREPNLSPVLRLARGTQTPRAANTIVIQSGPISDIGTLWLEYLRSAKPEVFQERWWRDRQPDGGDVRLGINVSADPEHRRLRVDQVFKNQPADGCLKLGDFIVGYNNRRFASDDLIAEIQTAIRERPHARRVELLIERDGVIRQVFVPLPFVDPVLALQRIVAIGKVAQRAVYHDDLSDPAGPRGFLTVELRSSDKPLFEFSQPVPIGAPDGASR